MNMKLEVLLVDDDEVFMFMYKRLLARVDFVSKPKSFVNGKEALNYFQSEYKTDKPYLIFLDINMPVMNGWEFLKKISSFANPDNTFVVITSSSTSESDKSRAFDDEFVKEFLEKPVMMESLLKISEEPYIKEFAMK